MQYLKFAVENKLIKDFVCPICEEPDTDNIDLAERHFECMDMLVIPQFCLGVASQYAGSVWGLESLEKP